MSCSKRPLLSQYIDSALSPEEKHTFEAHMNACPECGRALGELEALRRLFAASDRYKAPPGFSTWVMANIGADTAARPAGFPLFVKFAEGMVVLAMVIIGVLSGSLLISTLQPKAGNGSALFSLELFEAAPPDSVGGAYLAMTETRHEK
ncbi:MAG: zf-HC2 domain-containing protein [Nitrospirota bacterium]